MFLKAIEMQGFKSFADKTKVVFDQGVTAVVGPNGSGKSNITESLRWALGESSAKSLRGGKMPDVIFAGTEKRKPLNYAQVAVTLDNSDGFIADAGKTIRVERHIYRNGDSDYLIDGKKVRLKDIHNLFMDTGLGRDSFSIISQGRVEAIFNSKPEERRAIFEEAAGVLKYKTRKKETQAKLTQTQDNLDRLEDIIHELDMQIKPLEKQAATAKTFLALEESRKDLHLSLLVEDIAHYKGKHGQTEAALSEVQANLSTYYSHRQELEDKNQTLKAKRHQLRQAVEDKQAELLALTKLMTDYERRIEIIQLSSHQEAEKRASAKERQTELQNHQADLEAQLADTENKLSQLQEERSSLAGQIADLEQELATFAASPEQIMEGLRDDYMALMQEEATASNRLTAIQSDMAKAQEISASREQELTKLSEDVKAMALLEEEAKADHEAAQARVRELLQAYQTAAQELEGLKNTYQQDQSQLFQHLDEIKSREARRNSLLAIQKNHSNFYAGVKAVLQNSHSLPGIVGAVSEHLTFDPAYQTALEIALGGSSQHIIVADEAAAKTAIAFLKQNRQGRATFLPLTTIKPRRLSSQQLEKLQTSPGFLGLANDLVVFDQSLSQIFDNLLGVTAIFETIDQVNQAARKLQYQVRLVTLDGTELRPGGSFSGGATRQNNTVFVKPELDALTAEIDGQKQLVRELERTLSQQKAALLAAEDHLEGIKEEGERSRLAEQKALLEHEQKEERLADLQKVYGQLAGRQAGADVLALQEELTTLEQTLAGIATGKARLTEEMTQLKANKDRIEEKRQSLQAALSDKRLVDRELQGEERFARTDLERLRTDLRQVEEQLTLLLERLAATEPIDESVLPRLEADLVESRKRQEAEEAGLLVLKTDLTQCEKDLDSLAQDLQQMAQQNEEFIRRQAHLEADLEQLADKLAGFAKILSEDYQMSLTEAQKAAQPLENVALARQDLQDLKRQIKALGSVNLEAIEQFEEVSERLSFLSGQKADLDQAKRLLLDTIHEMDEEVKGRFKTTFEAIRESFKQTFTQMFGGGSSDLILTDGDLLTAGIEISVQPPGKKIQSLNLMSGGEKALSALALLFAIIRVKTIPFVILDEVEAALDEANVKRFGDYLNRFDKSSQFIVVTHRRGTMSAADSIYGVTMQESGVSKIVSVRLKEARELIAKG